MASPFDFVNNAKRGSSDLSGYVYFTTLNMMSSSLKLLGVSQMMNGLSFSRLSDETKAKITNEILRKYNKEFLSYPKGTKIVKDSSNSDLLVISEYMKCSIKEAKLYYENEYITDKDIKFMKEARRG